MPGDQHQHKKTVKLPSREELQHLMQKYDQDMREEVAVNLALPVKVKKHPLKEFLGFSFTTAGIFFALLIVSNFQAYLQVIQYSVEKNSGQTQAAQTSLEKMSEVASTQHNAANSELPTTPNEAQDLDARTSFESEAIPKVDIPVMPPDNRIIIAKIGQNIPIMDISVKHLVEENWKALEDDIQEALHDGVVHYPGTAEPGQKGNVFITGHSSFYVWDPGRYKDVFALLHNVEIGDKITVYYKQNKYEYIVTEKKVVKPDQVDVLKQTEDKRLTLMTCTPIGTALNRLVLVAKQV